MSSFLHTNMCSCGPYLLKIVIATIWQWIFSTILLRKLLSFLGLAVSPGNLSLLSGHCLVKYCFKKHSPGLVFWCVPGKELTCRWLQQFIRPQSSASLLPCARTASLAMKSQFPGFVWIWLAGWPETDVGYLTTDTGKILYLHIMGKCRIPLLQNKWVNETVTEMLREGDVRTVVSSSKAALRCLVYPWFRFSELFS